MLVLSTQKSRVGVLPNANPQRERFGIAVEYRFISSPRENSATQIFEYLFLFPINLELFKFVKFSYHQDMENQGN